MKVEEFDFFLSTLSLTTLDTHIYPDRVLPFFGKPDNFIPFARAEKIVRQLMSLFRSDEDDATRVVEDLRKWCATEAEKERKSKRTSSADLYVIVVTYF